MSDTITVKQCMLTTNDNPFDPFTMYDEWYAYDSMLGYNSASLLGRIVITSDELTEQDQALAIEQAIDEIIVEDPLDLFVKVSRTKTIDTV